MKRGRASAKQVACPEGGRCLRGKGEEWRKKEPSVYVSHFKKRTGGGSRWKKYSVNYDRGKGRQPVQPSRRRAQEHERAFEWGHFGIERNIGKEKDTENILWCGSA